MRLNDDGLLAVYDWDSVALVPESTAVGQAAVTWSVTADPGGTEFPTLPDIVGFVADYEQAAGHRLDETQWRAAGRSAAWVLAYTARCEHSLDAKGWRGPTSMPPATAWPTPAKRCSRWLNRSSSAGWERARRSA